MVSCNLQNHTKRQRDNQGKGEKVGRRAWLRSRGRLGRGNHFPQHTCSCRSIRHPTTSANVNDILILFQKQLTYVSYQVFQVALVDTQLSGKHIFTNFSHGSANHLPGSPREGEKEEQDQQTGDKLDGDSGPKLQDLDQKGFCVRGDEPQGSWGKLWEQAWVEGYQGWQRAQRSNAHV